MSDALVARGPHAVCTFDRQSSGSLTARHDSSPCADRGQSVIAYRTSGNCGAYETGETVDALTTGTDQTSHILAFSRKDHGADAVGISPTLRSMSASESHANGGGQVAIAIHDMATRHKGTNGSGADVGKGHGLGIAGPNDPMFTLTKGDHHAVAFGVSESPDVAHCLRSGASKADKHESTTYIAHNHIVRRLTPTECARLQGFPDNHCNIPWNGWRAMDADETPEQCIADGLEVRQNKKTGKWRVKDVDGPKYKAYGNSMAVPCMRWIGERIQMMNDL